MVSTFLIYVFFIAYSKYRSWHIHRIFSYLQNILTPTLRPSPQLCTRNI